MCACMCMCVCVCVCFLPVVNSAVSEWEVVFRRNAHIGTVSHSQRYLGVEGI